MNEKINPTDNSHSSDVLKEMKAIEKKRKGCKKVKVLNGYVITTNPEKWKEYNKQ